MEEVLRTLMPESFLLYDPGELLLEKVILMIIKKTNLYFKKYST